MMEGEDGQDNQVPNVVHFFHLQKTSYDKKSYSTYLSGYTKAIEAKLKETNPGRVEGFKRGAVALGKKVLSNFKDFEFYLGESKNGDAMVVLLNYRSDGTTPYLTAFKDGLK
ncbi:hypothetical protein DFQ27_000791, partial [Actinomortierella ambigua]